MENGKRKKKYIKSLVFVDGALLEDQQSITKDILNFFASLCNKSIEDTWRLEGWIGLQSLSWLQHPLQKRKSEEQFFRLDKEKALGLDGFTLAFYKESWDATK